VRTILALAVLVLTVAFLTACGTVATPPPTTQFTIEAKDNLTFTPNTITVSAGQPVTLTLVNNGKLDHSFTAPDLNIEVIMPAGTTNQVSFTAPKAGEYRFYSAPISEFDVMTGTVIVK
jgi:plastocyanin